jgi:hypothetical protein
MRSLSVTLLLDSTVLAMLAAAGCGGDVQGTSTPVGPDDAGADAASDARADVAVDPCAPPARGYSLVTCGDQGDRVVPYDCTLVYRQLPCGIQVDAGACGVTALPSAECAAFCESSDSGTSSGGYYCSVQTYNEGKSELVCGFACPGGRRPEGYGGEPPSGCDPLGRLFARLAQLETVSIGAFEALARELERHGAGDALVARARRAKRDEVRHARAAWSLARRFGAKAQRLARMPKARRRSIAELAEENAAEGCVRETFGAMVAGFQARMSRDGAIAETMHAISVDEAEHAALAWDLDAFFVARLDDEGRARRALALREAIDELRREVSAASDAPALARVSGMPSRRVALLALDALEGAILG